MPSKRDDMPGSVEKRPEIKGVDATREYIVYTDESDKHGKFFSNFYGGALVRSVDLASVIHKLESSKIKLNLHGEVKWQKVTGNYLEKYVSLMGDFFDMVSDGLIKVRIMFTQNYHVPVGLTPEQRQNSFHLLYYQFLKHAFGFQHSTSGHPVHVRLNLDQLPDNREQNEAFKSFVLRLNHNPKFRDAGVAFRRDQIVEVSSHDHVLLQCLDVALGAMCFRLNDKHREIPHGQNRRGNRTVAKEKLYKFILKRIRQIHPNFNIGMSTGTKGSSANRWLYPYMHWRFMPQEYEVDETKRKPK